MNQEQAAKYFVVAWVKDWSLQTYWRVITEKTDIQWDQAHTLFPWLPDEGWFIRNSCVRRFLAEAHLVLNDAMWDAKDDKARLALAPKIKLFQCGVIKKRRNLAREACTASSKKAKHERSVLSLLLAQRDRSKRAAWNVCK